MAQLHWNRQCGILNDAKAPGQRWCWVMIYPRPVITHDQSRPDWYWLTDIWQYLTPTSFDPYPYPEVGGSSSPWIDQYEKLLSFDMTLLTADWSMVHTCFQRQTSPPLLRGDRILTYTSVMVMYCYTTAWCWCLDSAEHPTFYWIDSTTIMFRRDTWHLTFDLWQRLYDSDLQYTCPILF